MTNFRRTALAAISVAVLATGCATYSEKAVAARLELADMTADGIERATETLAAKIESELLKPAQAKADADTIDAVLAALDDGMETDTLRLLYFDDVTKTRASLAAQRADWTILVEEFSEAAKNQRAQSAMTAEELRVAKKVSAILGGNK